MKVTIPVVVTFETLWYHSYLLECTTNVVPLLGVCPFTLVPSWPCCASPIGWFWDCILGVAGELSLVTGLILPTVGTLLLRPWDGILTSLLSSLGPIFCLVPAWGTRERRTPLTFGPLLTGTCWFWDTLFSLSCKLGNVVIFSTKQSNKLTPFPRKLQNATQRNK